MLSTLFSMFGKTQWIIIGVTLSIIALSTLFLTIKFGIEEKARLEIQDTLHKERLETLKKGRKIDETIFKADDVVLCAILGGCLQPNDKNPNN